MFVVAYKDDADSAHGKAVVGTLSGNAISFGSEAVFESGFTPGTSCTFDSNSNKVVIVYPANPSSFGQNYGHAVVATVDYTVSEDLTLHSGLGWGMADDAPEGWDDGYGFEADLGLAYKLYQNLTYELHFGYWFVGDFADVGGTVETEDVMLLSNHLTMKF